MRNIISFFIKRPVWGNAFIAIILIFGLFAISTTKRSFFPELDPHEVSISIFYAGASPSEMEEGVAIKIEQAIEGIEDIDEIRTTSTENFVNITVKAFQDANMDELSSEVENAVNSISSFPAGAERPIITRNKSQGMASVVAFVGVSAVDSTITDVEVTDMATKIEQDLLNTKEITQIEKVGFPQKEFSVNVRENDLLRYNISIQEVSLAISSKNLDLTAGVIRGGVQEMSIRSNNRGTTEEEIEEITLRTSLSGEKILIGDVADVVLGYAEGSQEAKFNGYPAVSFRIEKTTDQDLGKISTLVKDYAKKFNEENTRFKFNIYFEFNKMLDQRISLLSRNGMSGLILVLVFLSLFLNTKLAGWVAFGIPFSFLGMIIIGMVYGMSINMISLFGMILVVGILVDDGIVIAENIYTHFERGKSATQAALDGTMEVLPSVFSSVLTTIVAFSVLLFVEGLEMMREMAFVVIACLSFSLFEAFVILPAHLAHKSVLSEPKTAQFSLLRGILFIVVGIILIFLGSALLPDIEGVSKMVYLFPILLWAIGAVMIFKGFTKSIIEISVRNTCDKFIKKVRDDWYKEAVLMFTGRKRKVYNFSFFIPMIFLGIVIFLFKTGVILGTFFPDIPPDFFNIEVAYKPGDNKVETQKFVDKATQILVEENQRIIDESGDSIVSYFSSNIGFTQNLGQVGNHSASISVFVQTENASTPLDTLMTRIDRRLKLEPEGKLSEDIFVGGFNRFGKEIEVGLTSTNEDDLLKAKDLLKQEISKIKGVFNIKDNMPPGRREVYLDLLPQAEIYGISKNEILTQIRQGFFGQEAQRVIVGTDEIKIWVRYPLEDRNSLSDLEQMKIKTRAGLAIPLTELATFEMGRAPESLKRRNGQRIVRIDAESTDPDLVKNINEKIFDTIIPKITQTFPSVQSVKLGQFERSQKTGNSMMYVALIAIVLMFIIIMLHFNSLSQAFLIMLTIPAGIGGAIIGHGMVGIPVSILSVFGIIALLGVLVNDAIVFLDRYNDLLLEGFTVKEAAIDAATSRFRPILLTSLTTVAGLLPMISEKSMQAQFLIPMATSIAFGILFGTAFILFFYPSAILFWNGTRRTANRLWKQKRFTEFEVEPVLKLKNHQEEYEK